VEYGEVYKGIGLKLKAYGNNIEKIFSIAPGANPEDIKVRIEGAEDLGVNDKGELEVRTGLGTVKFTKPVAYQDIEGERTLVDIAYVTQSEYTYGFEVGGYDETESLTIDPLLASTFIGGANWDGGFSISTKSGYVYVAGIARTGFPTTPGAYDESFNGGDTDAFVSILDSNLSSLLVCTFIGGSDRDNCYSMYLDADSNFYITGDTGSTDFPTTPGAYDQNISGSGDVFVSKLNSSLDTLLASTYIGGSYGEYCYTITLDASENIYITGYTYSTNFPTTSGAYDETDNPAIDVFISKFDNDLSSLSASTYLGGNEGDFGQTILIYGTDTVFVSGSTRSTDFPTTPGAYDEAYNGGEDVFVAKLDGNLSTLSASTLIGGDDFDRMDLGHISTLDGSGNLYVTGETYSTNYPATSGAYDETYNGGTSDVFVSKFNNGLSTLLASTFLGGSDRDMCMSIVLDGSGNVYIAGQTESSNYPTVSGAYDETHNGMWDVFVSKLDDSLSTLPASTFLGGSSEEGRPSIAIDGSGNVNLTGWTSSSDFPTTPGIYDETHNGSGDVFVLKLDENLIGPYPPVPDIQANGSDQPIIIARWTPLSITAALDSGDHAGEDADFWALCKTPFPAPNDWYFYDPSSQSWLQGRTVSHQDSLFNFSSQEILNRSNLLPGVYTFYFGVDMNMNGSLNPAVLYYDSVQVTITP
jgi:hypothetical protein